MSRASAPRRGARRGRAWWSSTSPAAAAIPDRPANSVATVTRAAPATAPRAGRTARPGRVPWRGRTPLPDGTRRRGPMPRDSAWRRSPDDVPRQAGDGGHGDDLEGQREACEQGRDGVAEQLAEETRVAELGEHGGAERQDEHEAGGEAGL